MIRSLASITLAALLTGGAASLLPAQGGTPPVTPPAQAAPPVSKQAAPHRDSVTMSEVFDRIVAVVGTTPILESQVTEEILSRRAEGLEIPTDSVQEHALRRATLDTLIAVELYYQQAQADTNIKVTDQEVNDGADAKFNHVRATVGTQDQFIAELKRAGFQSSDDWRKWLVDQQRRALYINRFRKELDDDGTIKPVNPTEKEMKAFYDAHRDEFTGLATVSMRQIAIRPEPPDSAKARIKALADSLVNELRNKGADFVIAARRFSMDYATRDNGGDVGWFTHGKMVPSFEAAAFSLDKGQISNPVESSYGLHIIQVIDRQPTEVHARHILLIANVDSGSAVKARALADSIHALVLKGASFDSLQKLYSDPAEEKDFPEYPVDSLPPAYAKALAGVDSGQVSPIFVLPDSAEPFRSKYAMLQVTERAPAGVRPYSSELVKSWIRRALSESLGQDAYVNQLRAKTYIDIRDP